jgi:serine/threonine protein kinase
MRVESMDNFENQEDYVTINGKEYLKLNRIGQGAFGKIFCAVDELNRKLALKYIMFDEENTSLLQVILNETSSLSELKHENIVNVVDYSYLLEGNSSNEKGINCQKIRSLSFSNGQIWTYIIIFIQWKKERFLYQVIKLKKYLKRFFQE